MAAIIRDAFKVNTLKTIIASLTTNSLYLGIGRPQFWDVVSSVDTIVPLPTNTIGSEIDDWEDMMSLKKVTLTDAYHGIFKETWQQNTKYDTYRHDWDGSRLAVYNGLSSSLTSPASLGDVKCFVLTANFSVYVCLKQKVINGEFQPSIYSPETGTAVGVNTGVVKTADGYYWKFLATTSPADLVKFGTKYYHPIEMISAAPAPSDPYFIQWTSQENSKAFKAGIYTINVVSKGTLYNGGTAGTRVVTDAEGDAQFKVIGDGVGLQYTVTYGASGSIEDVEVTNPGTGYTHAQITAATGAGAEFDIIFTSKRGLGVDPVMDTVARYLLINIKLEGAEGSGDFTIENDFRKVMLVMNPTNYGTTSVATGATLDATLTLNVGLGLGVGAYPIDAIVTGATSGCKARVMDFNEVTGALRVIRTSSENLGSIYANNSFVVGEAVTSVPGTSGGTISTIGTPEVQPYSGDILYSEYRAPLLRSPDQSESLNIILKV